jgi:hypothetical protein
MTLSFKDGYEAAKQDFALHAHYEPPSETLSNEYRVGYAAGWTESRETADLPPNWEQAALEGIADREAKEKAEGEPPLNVILTVRATDGATGQIGFSMSEWGVIGSYLLGEIARKRILPPFQWPATEGTYNRTLPVPNIDKLEIEWK